LEDFENESCEEKVFNKKDFVFFVKNSDQTLKRFYIKILCKNFLESIALMKIIQIKLRAYF